MCGITGFWEPGRSAESLNATAHAMSGTLVHRGPDDGGTWVDEASGVAFGHRRLAVVDLSPEGHQPMVSRNGRWILNYNGEIYNHDQLRAELARNGVGLRGRSDTEVFVEAVAAWGLEAALDRANGMYGLALWDRQERTLHLARDRMGEKPLYFGWSGGVLLFASELKALRAHERFDARLDPQALSLFLRFGYVPAPHCIYSGIRKLLPGHVVTVASAAESAVQPKTYWDLDAVADAGVRRTFPGPWQGAADELETLLSDSVGLRMVADVPVGAFLSGGIDSSLVVALMQARASAPVRTFTIGFAEQGFDEAPHAAAVARHLGTEHTELYVDAAEARSVIPLLPSIYDEPFADSSQIPTFLVARLTRQSVTVALSGDGGDELFGGYPRYSFHRRVGRALAAVPPPVRRQMARGIADSPAAVWEARAVAWGRFVPRLGRISRPGEKLHKLARVLEGRGADLLYRDTLSNWSDPAGLYPAASEPPTRISDASRWLERGGTVSRLQHIDQHVYLPDDILVKVDRATMAVSLEARVPFLDHRVVEAAWRLPEGWKIRRGAGKWLLRQILGRYVPPALFDRPKMGFGLPVGPWLRGPLREWGESLLAPGSLEEGGLSPDAVRAVWREHQDGTRDHQALLWSVLMFQAWREEQRGLVIA